MPQERQCAPSVNPGVVHVAGIPASFSISCSCFCTISESFLKSIFISRAIHSPSILLPPVKGTCVRFAHSSCVSPILTAVNLSSKRFFGTSVMSLLNIFTDQTVIKGDGFPNPETNTAFFALVSATYKRHLSAVIASCLLSTSVDWIADFNGMLSLFMPAR